MSGHCTYNSQYDLYAEELVRLNISKIKKMSNEEIKTIERKLWNRVKQLNTLAITAPENKLENVSGNLYVNVFFLLSIMIETKKYSRKHPYDPEFDYFLKVIDEICYLFDEWSSELRSENIRKLAKKL